MQREVAALASACVLLAGCYTAVPVETAPSPGEVVVLDLNDHGRDRLGRSVGSSAKSIEGALDTRTDSGYVVKVSSVVYMNGQNNRWTNEPLTIQSDLVRELRVKKFSRGRTALFVGSSVGALVALIVTRQLIVAGGPDTEKKPGDGDGGSDK
jgi:hypothetical protein